MNCKPVSATAWTAAIALFLTSMTVNASAIDPYDKLAAKYLFSGTITSSQASGSVPDDLVNAGDTVTGELGYYPGRLGDAIYDYSEGSRERVLEVSMSNGTASWRSRFGFGSILGGINPDTYPGPYNLVVSSFYSEKGDQASTSSDDTSAFGIPGILDWTPPAEYPAEDVALPDELSLDNFSGGFFDWQFVFPNLYAEENGDILSFDGTIDQISRVSVSVSEPGSLVLLGIGLIAFARRFWRGS